MSFDDKAENKEQELTGAAKERWGGATGNENLQAEGAAERSDSKLKQAGEHIKDAVNSVMGAFRK